MDMDLWTLKQYHPRPQQVEILDEISDALDSGYENIILEAGTGIGKSAIATTVARMCNDSYILTMTNQLQKQYLQDFNFLLTEIKGRNNYVCNYGGYCDKCQFAEHNKLAEQKYNLELKKWKIKFKKGLAKLYDQPVKPDYVSYCEDCEYILALKSAQNSSSIITNYDYLFYAGNYAKQWSTRDLLVLDEAHNFEKKVMSLVSEELNRKVIFDRNGFDIFESVAKGREPLKNINNQEYWIKIVEKCLELETNAMEYSVEESPKAEMYIQKYSRILKKFKQNDYIIDLPLRKEILEDKEKDNRLKVEFKPLSAAEHSDALLHFGQIRLFMTGTLGNKDKFCEWNTLNADDTYYIYAKSPFPVEHRPIIRQYVCSMRQEAWRNTHILKYIERILSNHQREKGVIHTSSNQQAWWIKKNLSSKRLGIAYGATREQSIKEFEETPTNCVLIGAGLKDGVDFKGNKCRFQILFKVPYPSLGDEQVKIRRKLDPDWYAYQTVQPLQQAYGRGIRDMDDYCKFYVLDEDFEHLLHEYGYFFNEYFLEAVQ